MEVLAVIVRYKTSLAESETVRGLVGALSGDPVLASAYELLVWDNSPEPLVEPRLPIAFAYRYSERNLGVSGAYNQAIKYARKQGAVWMLLLDQDSDVTPAFLEVMLRHARELMARVNVAALVPIVCTRGTVISPLRQTFNRNRPYPAGGPRIAPGEATAANSGCMFRVSALEEIGGYDARFWLDYSDMYVFHQFFLRGKKVWLAADAELEHELSIMDYDRLMTPWRYRNFSMAETAYYDLYKGKLEGLIQTLRVFARAVKQRFKYRNPEFSRIAWEQFRFRFHVRRGTRIARWRSASGYRPKEARTS